MIYTETKRVKVRKIKHSEQVVMYLLNFNLRLLSSLTHKTRLKWTCNKLNKKLFHTRQKWVSKHIKMLSEWFILTTSKLTAAATNFKRYEAPICHYWFAICQLSVYWGCAKKHCKVFVMNIQRMRKIEREICSREYLECLYQKALATLVRKGNRRHSGTVNRT